MVVLVFLTICAVVASIKFYKDKSYLEATIDALELQILELESLHSKNIREIGAKWDNELSAYELTIQNLKTLQCNECSKEVEQPVVKQPRKTRK